MQYFNSTSVCIPTWKVNTALHSVIDTLSSNINDGSVSAVCALDMAKGFETFPHRLLLHKLGCYGFDHSAVTWFKSYLSRRTQIVKGVNTVSSPLPISIGVPQVSVLGPYLYFMSMNYLLF